MELKCSKCGAINKPTDRFCKSCGAHLMSLSSNTKSRVGDECPYCKTQNPTGARFCKCCGKSITKPVKSQSEILPPPDIAIKRFEDYLKNVWSLFIGYVNSYNQEIKPYESCIGTNDTGGWDDDIFETYLSVYNSNCLAFSLFLSNTTNLSDEIQTEYSTCRELIEKAPTDQLKSWRLDTLEKMLVENKRIILDKVNELQKSFKDNNSTPETNRFELQPINLWPDVQTNQNSNPNSYIYIGSRETEFNILGSSYTTVFREYQPLLNKKNLIVHYNDSTETDALNFTNTILAKYLKASSGLGIKVTVSDTVNFWGPCDQLRQLDPNCFNLISDETTLIKELDRIERFEINIIKNLLGHQYPTVDSYNKTHNNTVDNELFVISNFPVDVIGKVHALMNIMSRSATTGKCFIILINDDRYADAVGSMPKSDIPDLPSLEKDNMVFDFTNGTFSSIPSIYKLNMDLIDDYCIEDIVQEVNNAINTADFHSLVDVVQYMPKPERYWKTSAKTNITFAAGVDSSYSEVDIKLTDITTDKSVLVSGTIDSMIIDWMASVSLQIIAKYSPDEVKVWMVDLAGKGYFSRFEGIKSVRVITGGKDKASAIFQELVDRTKNSLVRSGRLVVLLTGIDALNEKHIPIISELATNRKGVHFIISDRYSKMQSWTGLTISFGPIKGISVSEFIVGNQLCKAIGADKYAIEDIIPSVTKLFPVVKKDVSKPSIELSSKNQTETVSDASDVLIPKLVSEVDWEDSNAIQSQDDEYDPVKYLRNYLPNDEDIWAAETSEIMSIPFGLNPNGEIQSIQFSQSVAQNAGFIIGLPGYGKSVCLHTIILSAIYKYSPDQLQLYLIDMSGVEFENYAKIELPHAKVVASEADREFAYSILESVWREAEYRQEYFREKNIRDFKSSGLPRILVIIDEFQKLFDEDDIIKDASKKVIEAIVKEYRKYGINLLIATQLLPSQSALKTTLINNRLIFNCDKNDFQALFGVSRNIPALGKGDCLYTDNGRLEQDTSDNETKVFFLESDDKDDRESEITILLRHLLEVKNIELGRYEKPVVFRQKEEVFFSRTRFSSLPVLSECPRKVEIYMGEPMAVSEDISLSLEGSKNDNVIILGGQPEVAQGIALHSVLSVAMQFSNNSASLYMFNSMREDAQLFNSIAPIVGCPFNPDSRIVPYDNYLETIKEIQKIVNDRTGKPLTECQNIFLCFVDFHLANLPSDRLTLEKIWKDILEKGPKVGIYTILQADRLDSLKDLGVKIDSFEHRIALQMSEEDSLSFIRKKSAAKLTQMTKATIGQQRAYYFSVRRNTIQKFKPYSYKQLIG